MEWKWLPQLQIHCWIGWIRKKIFKGQIAQMVNIFAPCFDGTVKDEEYLAFLFISPHRCCCCMERGGCAPAKPQKHIFICFLDLNFFSFPPSGNLGNINYSSLQNQPSATRSVSEWVPLYNLNTQTDSLDPVSKPWIRNNNNANDKNKTKRNISGATKSSTILSRSFLFPTLFQRELGGGASADATSLLRQPL